MNYDQGIYAVRLEWGRAALENLAKAEATIIVDVLSFSTSVDIAIGRGAFVYPYAWKGDRAERYAYEQGASLARERGEQGLSLSPASLVTIESGTRLVLPSPNGSSLSALATKSPYVLAACLRNASAVATYCRQFESVSVIPAGERWDDGSLRPALEDYLGAGAVIQALAGRLAAALSPEAESAKQAFLACQHNAEATLWNCSSGLELRNRGFARDVILAAAHDSSSSIPLLNSGVLNSGAYGQAH